MQNNKGFTIIEILVVISITLMIATAFFWNLTFRDRQTALSSAQILASVIREARDRSTYFGVPVNITINSKSASYEVNNQTVSKDFPLLINKIREGNNNKTPPVTVTLPPFGSLANSFEFFFVKGNYEVSVRLNKYAALVQIIRPH